MLIQLVRAAWPLCFLLTLSGCRTSPEIVFDPSEACCQDWIRQIEYPDACVPAGPCDEQTPLIPPPTVRRFEELEYVSLTLEEAIQLALANSEVIRHIGGRIVSSPATATTVFDPSIVETDPRFGVEAALAAFDAHFNTSLGFQHQEREINNRNRNLNWRWRTEDFQRFRMGLSKVTATGTEFSFDNETLQAGNNVPANRVPSYYDTIFSASVRQRLLQGGGLEFNRIAGPSATPGNYRGVLIGRLNTDIALTEFETAVRNLLRDVERAYWELHFAYREFDAKVDGRQYALEAWDLEKRRVEANLRPPDQEAFVREQYYGAQAAVENALSGANASPGVFGAEGELRSLLGLPASDGRLLRPSTPPLTADLQFDWEESLGLSLVRRVELRRQRWKVKQRELELVASRNFRLPRLDAVGQYQWRGFGDDLWGGSDGALSEVFEGDLQGWTLGVEMATPLGLRLGHAAVRNAELLLRREEAILREQERQVSLEVRGAFTELDRAYAVSRSNYNRHVAAQIRLAAERKRNSVGETRLDLVLEAQRNAVVADVAFHRALVDYNLAICQMNLVRGMLLESLQVYLTEGPVSAEACATAVREARRFASRCIPPRAVVPAPVSAGVYPQWLAERPTGAPEPQPADREGQAPFNGPAELLPTPAGDPVIPPGS